MAAPDARGHGGPLGPQQGGSPHDRYVVLEYLAEGGMGAIYRGKKLGAGGFEKEVVLKQLLPEFTQQPEFIDLFLREAKLSATLDHANIVRTIDLVAADDAFFIVMEYVRGGDLRTLAKRAKRRRRWLAAAAALYVAREVCSALSYAHAKLGPDGKSLGLIHRDVSPSNILISGAGEVKLTDFGIAKASTHRSVFYKVRGKVGYMSPEQARGEPLDHRSDLYSLAVCLYELVTGERLFVAATLTTTPEELYGQPIPRVSKKRPGLPEDLDALMWRALDAKPAGRFQNAAELADAILRVAHKHKLLMSGPELAMHLREVCGEHVEDWRSTEVKADERMRSERTEGFNVEESSSHDSGQFRRATAVLPEGEDDHSQVHEDPPARGRGRIGSDDDLHIEPQQKGEDYIELSGADGWADEVDPAQIEAAKKAAIEQLSRLSRVELTSMIDPADDRKAIKERAARAAMRPASQQIAVARAGVAEVKATKAAADRGPDPEASIETEQVERLSASELFGPDLTRGKAAASRGSPTGAIPLEEARAMLPGLTPATPTPSAPGGSGSGDGDAGVVGRASAKERTARVASDPPGGRARGRVRPGSEAEDSGSVQALEEDDDGRMRPWVVALAAIVIGAIVATVVALTGPEVPEPAKHPSVPAPSLAPRVEGAGGGGGSGGAGGVASGGAGGVASRSGSGSATERTPVVTSAGGTPDGGYSALFAKDPPGGGSASSSSPSPSPSPAAGEERGIAVDSSPSGAVATLGGADQPASAGCRTPCVLEARPGIHTVRVTAKGYQGWAGLVEVKAGMAARVLASLSKPRPKNVATGLLEVKALLPAEIYIDGRETGRVTGDPPFALPPGTYQVTLVAPSRSARPTAEVIIKVGKTTTTPLLRFR